MTTTRKNWTCPHGRPLASADCPGLVGLPGECRQATITAAEAAARLPWSPNGHYMVSGPEGFIARIERRGEVTWKRGVRMSDATPFTLAEVLRVIRSERAHVRVYAYGFATTAARFAPGEVKPVM